MAADGASVTKSCGTGGKLSVDQTDDQSSAFSLQPIRDARISAGADPGTEARLGPATGRSIHRKRTKPIQALCTAGRPKRDRQDPPRGSRVSQISED